jgi:hypothetical protein
MNERRLMVFAPAALPSGPRNALKFSRTYAWMPKSEDGLENSRRLDERNPDSGKHPVRLFGDLPHPLLEEKAAFFYLVFVRIPGNEQGLPPKIGHFTERIREDEVVPASEHFFAGGAVGDRKDGGAGLAGQLDDPDLHHMFGPLRAVGGDGQIGAGTE